MERERNENEEVIRRGKWIEGVHEDKIKKMEEDNRNENVGNVKLFEDEYGADLSVFDTDCLKGIESLRFEMNVLRVWINLCWMD